MRIANLTCLFVLGNFFVPAVLADDKARTVENDLAASTSVTNIWLTDPTLVVQMQPQYRTASSLLLGASTIPIIDFELDKDPALKRIGRLRNLSLLTFADKGQFRLFLGVNADGLAGLHITLLSRQDEGRILELLRMPYLTETKSVDDLMHAEKETH
jgi:hypothetical protein